MEFPHLNDTRFPNLDNVNVYAHQVIFDYTRWQPNTKAYLCNVRWNGDYEDCVKFEDDNARDDWFDELVTKTSLENPDCAVSFEFATNVVQSQVKVPVPYDRATQFNYLVVDVPVATSDDDMLPYETKDGNRRWHFFVEGFDATSPSTTRLDIRLDFWTQYINSVGFNYFLLERGHAPVAATDTDTYLENPMGNNDLLLTPDVDFGGETVSQNAEFIPFGNGKKYLCFASTCTPAQLREVGTVKADESAGFTDPTFTDKTGYPDTDSRWGKQYNVEGYGFGSGYSFADVRTPVGNSGTIDGRIPGSVTVYAVEANLAEVFLKSVHDNSPSFLKTVVACFMVARELLVFKSSTSLAGYPVFVCASADPTTQDIKLTKSMFNIPERYQRFAKLYTFPYSELEITDNDGKTVRVRIEETGSITAHKLASIAFPYLNMRVFLTGIGGKGSNTYKWQSLYGEHDLEISGSDWYRFCFDMGIPTYALYMDGLTSWEIGNYNRALSNARTSARINYQNTVRQANNVCNNSLDLNSANNTNAKNSALNAKNCTVNLSNTQHTNTNNDANTLDTNNANSRAAASDNTATSNACNTANTDEANNLDYRDSQNEGDRALRLVDNAHTQSTQVTAAENEATVTTANSNSASTKTQGTNSAFAQAVVGAGSAGALMGTAAAPGAGTAVGFVAGALSGGVAQAIATAMNSYTAGGAITTAANAACQANAATVEAVKDGNLANAVDNTAVNNLQHSSKVTYNNNTNANAVNAATATTNRNNECNKANTDNTTSNMRQNATNLDNANTTNAENTRVTSYQNADLTKITANRNAEFTRGAALEAAQDILRNSQNDARALFNDMLNAEPVKLCDDSGNYAPDFNQTRGLQLKVRTQSRNAIACAGDEFTRYGYQLNQIWQVDGLCLMNHFTYWKAKDCWVFDKCETSDLAQGVISDIFTKGVTVWSDPNEIGRVNPYDN